MKIGILSDNITFAEDLAGQISQTLKNSDILINESQSDEDIIFIDEKAEAAQEIKDIPIVLFLSEEKPINNADLIVKKPFKLEPMLIALKNNTLLPKVRRKECLTFKEYSLYPVKKEIVSDVLEATPAAFGKILRFWAIQNRLCPLRNNRVGIFVATASSLVKKRLAILLCGHATIRSRIDFF
jgi:hypothetical protein